MIRTFLPTPTGKLRYVSMVKGFVYVYLCQRDTWIVKKAAAQGAAGYRCRVNFVFV